MKVSHLMCLHVLRTDSAVMPDVSPVPGHRICTGARAAVSCCNRPSDNTTAFAMASQRVSWCAAANCVSNRSPSICRCALRTCVPLRSKQLCAQAADTKRPKPLAADTVTTPSRFDKPSNRNSEVPASSGARASPAGASEKAGDAPAGASKSDEDEEDCPFCVFMRGGGCGDAFRSWEKCVDENRGSADGFASKCGPATQALQVRCPAPCVHNLLELREDYAWGLYLEPYFREQGGHLHRNSGLALVVCTLLHGMDSGACR